MNKRTKSHKNVGGFCRACFSNVNLNIASEDVTKAYIKLVAQLDPEEPLCFCTCCGYLFHKVVKFLRQCIEANRLLKSFHNQKAASLEICYNLEITSLAPTSIYPSKRTSEFVFKTEESEEDRTSDFPNDNHLSIENEYNNTLDHPQDISDDSSGPHSEDLSYDSSQIEHPIRKSIDSRVTASNKKNHKEKKFQILNNEVTTILNTRSDRSNRSTRSIVDEVTVESDEGYSINADEDPLKTLQTDLISRITDAGGKATRKQVRCRDYCLFCEKRVLNFARHLFRQHRMIPEVRKMLSYPKNSKQRKDGITTLRKKGNYIINRVECQRPMRKATRGPSDYLPCINCLGFYARKQLWKHKKKCSPCSSKSNVQGTAQNFICDTTKADPLLQKHVFSKMRADEISLTAKKDPLICSYGVHYFKIHRTESRSLANVTSRKMRELAKLLIEIQHTKPEIKTLLDALKPENYDVVVSATKFLSRYNVIGNSYSTPTYHMNIRSSLKLCSSLAMAQVVISKSGEKSEKELTDLKEFLSLMNHNWRFDFSNDVDVGVNVEKGKPSTAISLASDLKLLNEYLSSKAEIAVSQLMQGQGSSRASDYVDLLETVFSRTLLLNRIRSGELEKLTLRNYQENQNFISEHNESDDIFLATEKILLGRYKCVTRSKGFPILFSPKIQHDVEALISLRSKFIENSNLYLFAVPSVHTPLNGYKVLYKYSKACRASDPGAIASLKFRKHTAVLMQLFSMSKNDFDQLSTFVYDTSKIHLNSCRPSDDALLTAKILKVLLLLKDGGFDHLRGKSIDEMDLLVEEELEGGTMSIDDVIQYAAIVNYEEPESFIKVPTVSTKNTEEISTAVKQFRNNKHCNYQPMKRRTLTPWTSEQKEVVLKYFQKYIESRKAPKRQECDALKVQHSDLLSNKDWLKIKVFVQNAYSKKPID